MLSNPAFIGGTMDSPIKKLRILPSGRVAGWGDLEAKIDSGQNLWQSIRLLYNCQKAGKNCLVLRAENLREISIRFAQALASFSPQPSAYSQAPFSGDIVWEKHC
jgi:hypothetical protein